MSAKQRIKTSESKRGWASGFAVFTGFVDNKKNMKKTPDLYFNLMYLVHYA